MTEHTTGVSDEELTAYLDGTLPDERRAQIDAALENDESLQARLAGLDLPIGAMRAVMAPAVLGAPQMPEGLLDAVSTDVVPANKPMPPRAGRWRTPLAIAASFAAGIGLTQYMQPGPEKPKWVDAVADYQALYVTQTLSHPRQAPAITSEVLSQAQSDFGVDLSGTIDLAGLDFKRAQMLGWNGKPLLQIAYLDDDGAPMALCLTRVSAEDRDPKAGINRGMAGVSWVADGVGYFLIGGADLSRVEALSAEVIARL